MYPLPQVLGNRVPASDYIRNELVADVVAQWRQANLAPR